MHERRRGRRPGHPTARLAARLAVFGLAVGSFAAVSLVAAPPSFAGSCGSSGNFFDGTLTANPPHALQGVHAALVVAPAAWCSSDYYQLITAWDMVSAASGAGWSQAGYALGPGLPCISPFAEYSQTGATSVRVVHSTYCYQPGQTLRPEVRSVLYTSGACSKPVICLQNIIDGVVMSTTPFDPYGSWPTPWSGDWAGEVWYYESNIPGTQAAPAQFKEMATQWQSDGLWHAGVSGLMTINSYPPHWGNAGAACGSYSCFNIWTNP